jgi:hypothetical protein
MVASTEGGLRMSKSEGENFVDFGNQAEIVAVHPVEQEKL